jgi:hypothetical protein
LGGLLGGDSAHDAAQAQTRAGREAQNFAYQQYLTGLGLGTPMMASGNAALNDLNSLFGYSQQQFQDPVALAQQNHAAGQAANNRIGAKAVLKMLKQGMSIKDIASTGTLKSNSGVLKRLAKHGVNANQIGMLQAGPYGQVQHQAAAPQGAPNGPNFSALTNSPEYQFALQEGQRNLGNSFAAKGDAFSGNALRGLSQFNQGLASGQMQNFIANRMNLIDGGQRQVMGAQQAGQNMGMVGAGILQNQGDARASGIANQGNMYGQALSGIGQAIGYGYANRQPQGQQAYDDYLYYGSQGSRGY